MSDENKNNLNAIVSDIGDKNNIAQVDPNVVPAPSQSQLQKTKEKVFEYVNPSKLAKARVDEGKTKEEKISIRGARKSPTQSIGHLGSIPNRMQEHHEYLSEKYDDDSYDHEATKESVIGDSQEFIKRSKGNKPNLPKSEATDRLKLMKARIDNAKFPDSQKGTEGQDTDNAEAKNKERKIRSIQANNMYPRPGDSTTDKSLTTRAAGVFNERKATKEREKSWDNESRDIKDKLPKSESMCKNENLSLMKARIDDYRAESFRKRGSKTPADEGITELAIRADKHNRRDDRNFDRSEKGVHKPSNQGTSQAGAQVRMIHDKVVPEYKEGMLSHAKEKHQKVINEQKSMPKPNLPKSEASDRLNLMKARVDKSKASEEKGVHKAIRGTKNIGTSRAGYINSGKGLIPELNRATQTATNDEHKKVLEEQKSMKKPNLPKSESMTKADKELKLGLPKPKVSIVDNTPKSTLSDKVKFIDKPAVKDTVGKVKGDLGFSGQKKTAKPAFQQEGHKKYIESLGKMPIIKPVEDKVIKSEKMAKAKIDDYKHGSIKGGEGAGRMTFDTPRFNKTRDRFDRRDREEKGVHKQPLALQDGISSAGFNVRTGFPSSIKTAKDKHKKVIEEQKEMPKPNLPKSESMMKARVDEGKSRKEKAVARSERHKRAVYFPRDSKGKRIHGQGIETMERKGEVTNGAAGRKGEKIRGKDIGLLTSEEQQKGIHTPVGRGNRGKDHLGESVAGSRNKDFRKEGFNYSRTNAKDIHKKVLEEQKSMPKPNLPKSELMTKGEPSHKGYHEFTFSYEHPKYGEVESTAKIPKHVKNPSHSDVKIGSLGAAGDMHVSTSDVSKEDHSMTKKAAAKHFKENKHLFKSEPMMKGNDEPRRLTSQSNQLTTYANNRHNLPMLGIRDSDRPYSNSTSSQKAIPKFDEPTPGYLDSKEGKSWTTRSGKPMAGFADDSSHHSFTTEDHKDGYDRHVKRLKQELDGAKPNSDTISHHLEQIEKHKKKMKQ